MLHLASLHGSAPRAAVFLLAAAAAGCAVATPKPLTPAVAVPAAWSRSAADAAIRVQTEPVDLSRWWSQFDDPVLAGLVDQALAANLDVRSAQSRLREARLRRDLVGRNMRPTVTESISGSGTKTSQDTNDEPWRRLFNVGLDASWEPDIFGGARLGVMASQADLETTAATLRDTQVTLVAEVARNYVDLRSYQARLVIAGDNLARQAETLQLNVWRAQAGLASELEVEQARANVEQTRAQIPALETGVAEAQHRLAVLAGQPPSALRDSLAAPGAVPAVPAFVVIGIPADALRQRPDLRAAERRLFAESARLGQALADRYPTIRLSGTFGLATVATGGLSAVTSLSRSLVAGLTDTVFDRDRIRRQIDIQGAVEEQALLAYEQAILTALEDVENALVQFANVRQRRVALAASADAARMAATLARDRYTAGLVSYQTVLDTERSLLSAEDGLTSSEAEGATALIRLYKAMGGGWTVGSAAEAGANQSQ